jgi:outer membrane lipoprotein-sorting protein
MFAKAFMIAATVMVQSPAAPAPGPVLAKVPAAPARTPAAPALPALPTPEPISIATPFRLPLAPSDPTRVAAATPANQIVGKVQAFYKNTTQFTAAFRQTYINKGFGDKSIKDGRLYVQKPGKMRWDYQGKGKGLRSSFISDGTTAWLVDFDNKQYAVKTLNDSIEPVAISFLYGKGNLLTDFSASVDKSNRYGTKTDHVIKLIPKTLSAQYKQLYLVVDPGNYRVKESIIIEAGGNTNQFKFYEPEFDKSIGAKFFYVDTKNLQKQHFSKMNPSAASATAAGKPGK